jgi:hypothetical protein
MDKIKKALNKAKAFILGTNFAMIGFVAFLSKIVLITPNISDAIIMFAVCGLYGYTLYLKHKTPDPVRVNNELEKRLNDMNSHINALKLERGMSEKKKNFKW